MLPPLAVGNSASVSTCALTSIGVPVFSSRRGATGSFSDPTLTGGPCKIHLHFHQNPRLQVPHLLTSTCYALIFTVATPTSGCSPWPDWFPTSEVLASSLYDRWHLCIFSGERSFKSFSHFELRCMCVHT